MFKFKPSILTLALAAAGLPGALWVSASHGAEPQQAVSTEMADAAAPIEVAAAQTQSADAAEAATQEEGADEKIQPMETIEVTGYGRTLFDSLNAKRFGDTVSEQLTSDDLGALPDVSMADALTRLPGISAVRTGGQAAEINIRGMSGGFVFSTLNGREQVSTSGSRSIEFDQYPSELISSAAVYKSPKASLIEGGLAGTVELVTASPLGAAKDQNFTANVRGMYNDRASEVYGAQDFGNRLSFSYQGKFLDETLGLAAGYARLEQPSVATQFIGLAYNDAKDVDNLADDTNGPDDPANASKEYISEGFELQHLGGVEVRNGYMAAVEWAPVEVFTLKADAFQSRFDSQTFARGFRVKLGGPSVAIANPILDGNSVIGGTFNRTSQSYTRVEMVNDDNRDYDKVDSYGINADWQVTDRLSASFDASLSKASSDFRNGLLWSNVAVDANAEKPIFDENISISYKLNGLNLPDVGFNQADAFSDINRMMVSKYGIYPYVNEDRLDAYRLDLEYEFDSSWAQALAFGLRWSDRTYSNDRSVFEYGNDAGFSATEPPLKLTPEMVRVVNWKGDFSYFPSYLAINLDKALNAWFPSGVPQPVQTWGNAEGVLDPMGYKTNYSWSVLQSGEVYEKVLASYLMLIIDAELGSLPLKGNVGVRRVDTDQSATMLQNVGGDPSLGAQYIKDQVGIINSLYAPTIVGVDYADYLPSLNLGLNITDEDIIRFAAARVMSRPPINRLAGDISASVNDDGEINGSSTNNPFLRPFYADQYDISYEWYFEEGAFVAALFYKDVKSFIDEFVIDGFDFRANGFNVPEFIIDPVSGEQIATTNGTYTTAVNNTDGGYIRGLELAYTQVYASLPEPLNGFGVNASYSYNESEVSQLTSLGGETVSQPLDGLSKNVANLTLFYGYGDFDTRINARYRSDFVSAQVAINSQVVNFDGETVLDYQASYQVNDTFGVLFQVNNLTDEPTKSYFGTEEKTGTLQYFGRQYYLGVTYAM